MTSQGICVWGGGHDSVIFTKLYVILLTLRFPKTFKSIFLKQSFRLKTMYAEHWRKLEWATFLGNFPIFLVQQYCGALMSSSLLKYATAFPIKSKFQPVILTFNFDLVLPFYFLK